MRNNFTKHSINLILICLLFFKTSNLIAQCNITNYVGSQTFAMTPGTNGINQFGQSFKATCNGSLLSITINCSSPSVGSIFSGTLTVSSSGASLTPFTNFIYNQPFTATVGSGGVTTVTLSSPPALSQDSTYLFFFTPSSNVTVLESCPGSYADGGVYYAQTAFPGGYGANYCDLNFGVNIGTPPPPVTACSISNLVGSQTFAMTPGTNGINQFGQSFKATCNGSLLSITINCSSPSVGSIFSGTLTVSSSGASLTPFTNFIYNQPFTATVGSGGVTTVTLSSPPALSQDSTYLFFFTPSSNVTVLESCPGSYADGGVYYAQTAFPGGYGANYCDLNFGVNIGIPPCKPTTDTITLTQCGSYLWHGTNYTKSGSYSFDTLNVGGCDSLNILKLTINDSVKIIKQPVVSTFCLGYNAYYTVSAAGTGLSYNWQTMSSNTWIDHPSGGAWDHASTYTDTAKLNNTYSVYNIVKIRCIVTGTCNADTSIIFTPVLISASHSKPDTINTCNTSYTWHSKTFNSSGTFYDTVGTNVKGCDSIATLKLSINPAPTVYTLTGGGSFCAGGAGVPVALSGTQTSVHYYVYVNGILSPNYQQGTGSAIGGTLQYPGTYTLKATDTITGCTANMNGSVTVIVNQPSSSITNITNCDNYTWHNKNFATSGVYRDTLKGANSNGCDSLTTLNLTINPSISGNIVTPLNKGIPAVTASLKSTSNVNNTFSNNYKFSCTTSGSNDTIHLTKNNDITKANGVTTLDIALVQAHILQKSLLNSPYKIIAADVNGDGSVTTLDIVYMKRVILGIDTTFTNSSTKRSRLWTFVDSSYKFVDSTNPFPYKDSISLTALSSSKYNQSFIGIKLGDVNWDWNPAVARPQINTVDAIELSAANDVLKSSDGYIHIPVKVKNFKEMLGMQFTLQFDANNLQWKGIANNTVGVETGTNHAEEGSISFLWLDKENNIKTLADGTVLMELVFVPKNPLSIINSQLSISNAVTAIAAYDKDYNLHGIVMKPSLINVNEPVAENWTVSPNPVTGGMINVSMNLKDSKIIVLRLLDNTGKVLLVKKVDGVKGRNTIPFSLQNQLSNGSYYIQAIGIEGESGKRIVVGN